MSNTATSSMGLRLKQGFRSFGVPRLIIIAFLLSLWTATFFLDIPFPALLSDSLVRLGMTAVLALAMMPSILGGTGLYFGLPLGIICGLVGGLIAIEVNLTGFAAFFGAILFSIPLSLLVGWLYGWTLNRVKGSEMTISTYVGFAVVSLMSIGWLQLPFRHPDMAWAIGRGVRVTISLEGKFDKVLNNFLSFTVGGVMIPTGLLLFMGLCCFLVWLFFRSRTGIAIKAGGMNPRFAQAMGINVDKTRIWATILSTMLGAIGILVYAQSYGFMQLYGGPMYMGFLAASCILIGGASIKNANIFHVILGTFLFQSLLTVALPVANSVATLGSLAEISRIIVSNGIILYALAQKGGGE